MDERHRILDQTCGPTTVKATSGTTDNEDTHDEFADTRGTKLAIELGARSADHLIRVSPEGIRALARSDTAATLLPPASFYLKPY